MHAIIEKIRYEIENNLPGEESHLLMSPLGRGKSSELIKTVDVYKNSSVALILLENENRYEVVLTKRATYNGAHSGQISFPGGREEVFDKSPLYTAIRETKEEINFDLSSAEQLGKLSNVFVPVSKFLVRPYVFYTPEPLIFSNNREVVETFTIPLELLLDDRSISKMQVLIGNNTRMTVPCFCIENHQIWGATAIMLNEFKQLLKNVYK